MIGNEKGLFPKTGWSAMGAEDMLRNHGSEQAVMLADRLRIYTDSKAKLASRLMAGLEAIKKKHTNAELEAAKEEYREYIQIRERGYNVRHPASAATQRQQYIYESDHFYSCLLYTSPSPRD